MSFLVRVWKSYLGALERSPFVTKSLTAGTLLFTGDVIGQKLIERNPGWDIQRTARMTSLGLFFTGPTLHFWYKFLATKWPSTTLASTIGKVAVDQTIIGPAILCVFLGLNPLLAGESVQEVQNRLMLDFFPTLKVNWSIWPAAMLINFRFVPPNLQVLYVSSFALCWNIYLSVVSNRKIDSKVEKDQL